VYYVMVRNRRSFKKQFRRPMSGGVGADAGPTSTAWIAMNGLSGSLVIHMGRPTVLLANLPSPARISSHTVR
jgi:hypothetical protein